MKHSQWISKSFFIPNQIPSKIRRTTRIETIIHSLRYIYTSSQTYIKETPNCKIPLISDDNYNRNNNIVTQHNQQNT